MKRINKADAYEMANDYIEFAPVDIEKEKEDYNTMAKNIIEVYYSDPTEEEIEIVVNELNYLLGME